MDTDQRKTRKKYSDSEKKRKIYSKKNLRLITITKRTKYQSLIILKKYKKYVIGRQKL